MGSAPLPVRHQILRILEQVIDHGAFASEVVDRCLSQGGLGPKDAALLTQSVYGVLREKGFLDHVLKNFLKGSTPALLKHGLRFGVYQLLFLDKIPDHAAINETVEWAKGRGGRAWGGVVNAVLRRVLEQRDKFLHLRSEVQGEIQTLPPWLWRRWEGRYGQERALALLREFNRVPGVFFRINPLKGDREAVRNHLASLGVASEAVGHDAMLQLASGSPGVLREVTAAGWGSIQDAHSYQVTRELNPAFGEQGLDLCAGHGGKTAAIAEQVRAQGEEKSKIYAWDPNRERLLELKENFKRLGLEIPEILNKKQVVEIRDLNWVLVDAPCTGLGTLGRKPEIRWRTDPRSPGRQADLQGRILAGAATALRPGGRILYSVCSLEPEEGPGVVQNFLQEHPHWEEAGRGELWPGPNGSDGFFWARLKRKS